MIVFLAGLVVIMLIISGVSLYCIMKILGILMQFVDAYNSLTTKMVESKQAQELDDYTPGSGEIQ